MQENLGIISDIKQCLLEDILTDEKAVKLITNKAQVTLPAMELRYKQVVPWAKVPDTVESVKTFVTFEVSIPSIVTAATCVYRLSVYAMAHEDLMKVDAAVGKQMGILDRGDRIDILSDRISYLINGSRRYTFDVLQLTGSDPFTPCKQFYGRKTTYEIRGWNRIGDRV